MKQKPTDAVLYTAIYLLFGDLYNYVIKSKFKEDENRDIEYRYFLSKFNKATDKEDTIRKLWGCKCQNLLSGILLYLYKLDRYFSPKLNTLEQFFIKVYRHRKILSKIGSGKHEVVFPFVNLINKKKPLLIRCLIFVIFLKLFQEQQCLNFIN